MRFDRRLFILTAAALPLYSGPAVLFTDSEAKLIATLTGHIIPADDVPWPPALSSISINS
jgi:hypothetical protein